MQSITVSRTIDASPSAVRSKVHDVEPFIRASGFDTVDVDGDTITVANRMGPTTIELTLAVVDDDSSDFAFEQREGLFDEMRTTYTIESTENGCEITATTEFGIDVALVGGLLDATVIKRQRRNELDAQFDWLESVT
jgi:hypothetical protein